MFGKLILGVLIENGGEMSTITGAGYWPDANGFTPGGDWLGTITGGTTISGTWQLLSTEGNWADVPDNNTGSATVTGAWSNRVAANRGEVFRFDCLAATGTWDISATLV